MRSGDNLKKQGKHDEAVDLFERELQGCAALHGTEHKETKVGAVAHLLIASSSLRHHLLINS